MDYLIFVLSVIIQLVINCENYYYQVGGWELIHPRIFYGQIAFAVIGVIFLLMVWGNFFSIRWRLDAIIDRLGMWRRGILINCMAGVSILTGVLFSYIYINTSLLRPVVRDVSYLLILLAVITLEFSVFILFKANPKLRGWISWLVNDTAGNWTALGLIYAAAVVLTLCLNTSNVYGPYHYNDEIVYWTFARDFFDGKLNQIFTESLNIPPVYPLFLLPAFWFPLELRYGVVKVINVLYITSAIFPVYLICKKLMTPQVGLAGAVVILLQPFYLIFPREIMSENLYLPVLMWTLAVGSLNIIPENDGKNRWIEPVLFGFFAGLLYLIRYISLGAIPVFLLIWWLKPFRGERGPLLFSKEKLSYLLVIIAEMCLMVSIWVWLGNSYGLGLLKTLGFARQAEPLPEQLTLDRLWMWAVFYLAYTVMIGAPLINLIALGIIKFDFKEWREARNRWMITVFLISGSFLAVCIRHSWVAAYNYPVPIKLQGRYIFFFAILFTITALTLLSKSHPKKLKIVPVLIATLFSVGVLILSYLVLSSGYMYLPTALNFSLSSPVGTILQYGIGPLYYIGLAVVLQIAMAFLFVRGNEGLSITCISIGVGLIYLLNFPGIYSELNIKQEINYAAGVLVDKILEDTPPDAAYQSKIVLLFDPDIEPRKTNIEGPFIVRGFNNIETKEVRGIINRKEDQNMIVEMDGEKRYMVYRYTKAVESIIRLNAGYENSLYGEVIYNVVKLGGTP